MRRLYFLEFEERATYLPPPPTIWTLELSRCKDYLFHPLGYKIVSRHDFAILKCLEPLPCFGWGLFYIILEKKLCLKVIGACLFFA